MPFEIKYPSTDKGLNKWTWDLKSQGLNCIENITLFAGFDGPRVTPGKYCARVSMGKTVQEVSFDVKMDSRLSATDEEIQFWSDTLKEVSSLVNDSLESLEELRQAQEQIEALMVKYPEDSRPAGHRPLPRSKKSTPGMARSSRCCTKPTKMRMPGKPCWLDNYVT